MRNVLDKYCRENQNTHFMFSNFLCPKNRAIYEIMLKKMVQPERPQMMQNMGPMCYMLDKQGYAHAHAHDPGHPHVQTHANAHTDM